MVIELVAHWERRLLSPRTAERFPALSNFNMQAYQGKRNSQPVKRPAPVKMQARELGQWPASMRFD